MTHQARLECTNAVRRFSQIVNKANPSNILYVGIAGDPPGGEYSPLFYPAKCITFDADPVWKPDVIGDITKTSYNDNELDAIIIVQVIEHIPNVFDLPQELYRITKPGGYIIIDCPWMYPYHAEPPSFGDYWRITKDGFNILFKKWELVDLIEGTMCTSCLFRKPE